MTAPGWERSGKGYRLIEEGRAFRAELEQAARCYLWACFLYYHGPANTESPLSDDEFDRLQATLARYWSEVPDWFKARVPKRDSMKSDAHALTYTAEEKRQALAWAKPRRTR